MAPYILYTTGQHQRLPRHLLARQISPAAFIFNCSLGSATSRCRKARSCGSERQQQDGIIPFHLSAFTLSLNELIRRYAGSWPVALLCAATTTHLTKPGPFLYVRAVRLTHFKSESDLFIFKSRSCLKKGKIIKSIFLWCCLVVWDEEQTASRCKVFLKAALFARDCSITNLFQYPANSISQSGSSGLLFLRINSLLC